MTAIYAKAPGKTILFGEHAVVYGQPAIAVPVDAVFAKTTIEAQPRSSHHDAIINLPNLGITRNFADFPEHDPIRMAIKITCDHLGIEKLPAMKITISSNIPMAAGLGSSAAVAIATIKAVSQFLGFSLEKKDINELAFQVEILQHGKPSGIDNSTIAYNQPLYFIKDQSMEFLELKKPIKIILADSGIKSLTKEAVASVRDLYQKEPWSIGKIFEQIGEISRKAKAEIINGNLEMIGNLMYKNHLLLVSLGVSCDALDKLVDAAMSYGAFGAKLCGGGNGGNVIVIAPEAYNEKIISVLKNSGAVNAFTTTIDASRNKEN